jgi:hypothetical protein
MDRTVMEHGIGIQVARARIEQIRVLMQQLLVQKLYLVDTSHQLMVRMVSD